jgi:hypothetical protein
MPEICLCIQSYALKALEISARGNALGQQTPQMRGALKGRHKKCHFARYLWSMVVCYALSGLVFLYLSIPRALPWADM